MPIYEFRCAGCGQSFEELVLRRQDSEAVVCPRCGSQQVTQLLSSFACGAAAKGDGGAGGGCGGGGGTFS